MWDFAGKSNILIGLQHILGFQSQSKFENVRILKSIRKFKETNKIFLQK